MRAMRVCMVGVAFALAGCATARTQTNVPAAPMRADGASEERQLDAQAARCDQDLGICEQRVASMAAMPGFWDSSASRVLLIGLGFLAGMSATVGIATVVE